MKLITRNLVGGAETRLLAGIAMPTERKYNGSAEVITKAISNFILKHKYFCSERKLILKFLELANKLLLLIYRNTFNENELFLLERFQLNICTQSFKKLVMFIDQVL